MREEGFEPSQALSYESLNLARLTTPAFPQKPFLQLYYLELIEEVRINIKILGLRIIKIKI